MQPDLLFLCSLPVGPPAALNLIRPHQPRLPQVWGGHMELKRARSTPVDLRRPFGVWVQKEPEMDCMWWLLGDSMMGAKY